MLHRLVALVVVVAACGTTASPTTSVVPGSTVATVTTTTTIPATTTTTPLADIAAATAGNGPVLLVDGTTLLQAVADEIVRLTPDRIVVVGGTTAVSDAVLTALDALQGSDTVDRISGPNRYATAAAISEDAFPGGSNRVYIATGLNFPDALAGAAAAGTYGAPVLPRAWHQPPRRGE